MTPTEHMVSRIDAAERRMQLDRDEVASASSQLEAIMRHQGAPVPGTILDGALAATRLRVGPILNRTGRLPYLGDTT